MGKGVGRAGGIGVLAAGGVGEFSLRPQQGEVRALFVPLAALQSGLDQPGRANTILVAGGREAGLDSSLREKFAPEDLGVKLRALPECRCIAVESDSIFVGDGLAESARAAAGALGWRSAGVLAYLANTILSQIRLDMANIVFYDDTNAGNYAPRTVWRNQVEALLPGISIATAQRVPEIDIVAGPTYVGDTDPPSRVTVTIRWLQPGETQERRFEIVGFVSRQ